MWREGTSALRRVSARLRGRVVMAEMCAEDAVPTAGTNVEPKKRKKFDPGQHKCWWTGCSYTLAVLLHPRC
eukprot:6223138-Prymnesium_polylepis.1